jgi:predicted phage baseplate assembly protein
MPIRPPALDDRSFDDLVAEALSRIPAHTPEWTNPRLGDPGRSIVELFAWLTDTLLYRANLVPERQRLAFLRLLGVPMRPAMAARAVISVFLDDENATKSERLAAYASLSKPVPFETRHEMTVLPVTAEPFYKRPLSKKEEETRKPLLDGLRSVYRLPGKAKAYMTTPVFTGGAAEPNGFDVIANAIDRSLWLALLARKPDQVETLRKALGSPLDGAQQILNIGVVPAVELPAQFGDAGPRPRVSYLCDISNSASAGGTEYHQLDVLSDSTDGLTQRGVIRVVLPAAQFIGAPANDVRRLLDAGVADRPPRLDVPETADRVVAWIRLRPKGDVNSLKLSWVGINAVEIDQRQTVTGRVIGQSTGAGDQVMSLASTSVESSSLDLQVDETGRGYITWKQIDDLATAGRDDAVYVLDAEAGTVRFGDGVRGRIPETGHRVRVARMRSGGGTAGNLPPGSLTEISAYDLTAKRVQPLRIQQSVPTIGGADPETLAEAERSIPAMLRHRDRAVTERDYREISAATPSVRLGRVEVLSRFKPQQRRHDVPGVVTVMVLPYKDGTSIPAPRPDRPTIEAVHAHLDTRRTLGTELYVIGCEYVPVAVSVGVYVRDGYGHDTVGQGVRDVLRGFLWPLSPGGADGTGWPLGRAVIDRELWVMVARVPGVDEVSGVKLFAKRGEIWQVVTEARGSGAAQIRLERWQLPELLGVAVATDGTVPSDVTIAGAGGGVGGGTTSSPSARQPTEIAVPVTPEVC